MKRIWICGASGLAREALDLIAAINDIDNTWQACGFIVDENIDGPNFVKDLPVLKGFTVLANNPDDQVFVAVGSSRAREGIVQRLSLACKNRHATLIHPRATIGRDVVIGNGTMISAGAILTTDIKIGNHVHINLACTIGHDTSIEDFASLNPRVSLSGNTKIGRGVELGTGAVVIPKHEIGDWSVVGAGAVVTRSLSDRVTAVGVPAQVIKKK